MFIFALINKVGFDIAFGGAKKKKHMLLLGFSDAMPQNGHDFRQIALLNPGHRRERPE